MCLAQWHSMCPFQGHPTKTWKNKRGKREQVLLPCESPFFLLLRGRSLQILLCCHCFVKHSTYKPGGLPPKSVLFPKDMPKRNP